MNPKDPTDGDPIEERGTNPEINGDVQGEVSRAGRAAKKSGVDGLIEDDDDIDVNPDPPVEETDFGPGGDV